MKKPIINISYNCKDPINELNLEKRLSNLYPYSFVFNDVEVSSWEGFIQSLKTEDIHIKQELWKQHGYWAWKKGQKLPWWEKQEVYWHGDIIDRHSKEYTNLITSSYDSLYHQNREFKNALKESLPYKLDHSKGKINKFQTLLTKKEFLFQMERLRNQLKTNNFFDLRNIFE